MTKTKTETDALLARARELRAALAAAEADAGQIGEAQAAHRAALAEQRLGGKGDVAATSAMVATATNAGEAAEALRDEYHHAVAAWAAARLQELEAERAELKAAARQHRDRERELRDQAQAEALRAARLDGERGTLMQKVNQIHRQPIAEAERMMTR